MPTPRVNPPVNADGTRKTYAQRSAERREADDARRKQEKLDKQQAAEERRLNPPPAPLPFKERQALRVAEDQGRKDAEAKAAAEAAAVAPPVNPHRRRAAELQSHLRLSPINKKLYEHELKLAQEWDARQVAAKQAAERQAAIDSDPQVKTARDYAVSLLKTAPTDFQTEAAEINGIALAGDAQLAWSRIRDLERRIWQRQDEIAAEKRASKAATDQEFNEAADAALQARERAEHSAKVAEELNPGENVDG